jgi:hypothetical protein
VRKTASQAFKPGAKLPTAGSSSSLKSIPGAEKKVKDEKGAEIGKYDGALESDSAGAVVEGDEVDDLALDSSMIEYVLYASLFVTS